jgi:hypothetical protein
MTKFILLCLVLGILVKIQSPYQEWFKTVEMYYLGIACILIAISAWLMKKTTLIAPFDWFAVGAFLIWFYRWHQFYRDDAPMFYLFPLFFAIITAVVTLYYINQRDHFDQEAIEYLQYFSNLTALNTGFIAMCVILSLFLTDHFMLYPVAMVVYILRFVLSSCLENHDQKN